MPKAQLALSTAEPLSAAVPSVRRRILFIQATEPAAYPPLINAAMLFADAGWEVAFLGAPSADKDLALPAHSQIRRFDIPVRPSYAVTKADYARYCASSLRLARSLKPDLVYASDPIGALPGLLATWASGARFVYHEHDSPNRESELNPLFRRARRAAVCRAEKIVFPNRGRAEAAQFELRFELERLSIVWNAPSKAEIIAETPVRPLDPFVVYYHGTITPDRLPETVAEAVARLGRPACLRIAGYETPSGYGYIERLESRFGRFGEGGVIEFIGQIDRSRLLSEASKAHVGLALMPIAGGDINMQCMVGASNKAFDYMAAGLPLLVSDLSDWRETFVSSGHALAVDPASSMSVAAALQRLTDHPAFRAEMGARNRAKIAADWNYERQFEPVLLALGRCQAVSAASGSSI